MTFLFLKSMPKSLQNFCQKSAIYLISLNMNPFYIFLYIHWMRKTYNSHKTKVLTEKNLEVTHG